MQRLNVHEFLEQVLAELADLPEGFAASLLVLVEGTSGDRAAAIRRLIEGSTRG